MKMNLSLRSYCSHQFTLIFGKGHLLQVFWVQFLIVALLSSTQLYIFYWCYENKIKMELSDQKVATICHDCTWPVSEDTVCREMHLIYFGLSMGFIRYHYFLNLLWEGIMYMLLVGQKSFIFIPSSSWTVPHYFSWRPKVNLWIINYVVSKEFNRYKL